MQRLARSDADALREQAAAVLLGNARQGYDRRWKRDFAYTSPARKGYPWQWFWDSCFHAIALTHIDLALAKQELRTLLAAHREDGFVPHMLFWGARLPNPGRFLQSRLAWNAKCSALIQPPVLAQAVLTVYERSQDRAFLTENVEKVKRYYLWLRDNRDPDGDNLIAVISPYETGMDQLPAYDAPMGSLNPSRLGLQVRGRILDARNLVSGRNYNSKHLFGPRSFNVEDLLVNCVYAQGLRATAGLCELSGDKTSGDSFIRIAKRVEQAILAKCYDKESGAFFGLAGREERPLRILTCASLMPLILEDVPKEILTRLIDTHLRNPSEFWLDYPVPSVARSEPAFRAAQSFLIWRGATWININWFLYHGLRKHGFQEAAAAIAFSSAQLVLKSGYREFYNPLTGEGYGEHNFGWSTLLVDML